MTEQPMGSSEEQAFTTDEFVTFEKNGRFYDPARVWRRLMNHPTIDIQKEMERLASPVMPDDYHEALEAIVQVVIPAFDMEPFDPATGKGTTETEAFLMCRDFMNWVMEVKKKLLLLPTRWQLGAQLARSAAPSTEQTDGSSPSTTEGS